jgi:MOSC domain-containing protein YiiM
MAAAAGTGAGTRPGAADTAFTGAAAATTGAGRVVQVNVSPGGVPKRPVERAWVGRLGPQGDGHAEPEPTHGGPDRAVCLYTVEAIARVAADGHTAFPGAYGENLTLEGIEIGLLASGTRLAVGSGGLVLEITESPAPCYKLAGYFVGGRIARISEQVHPEDVRQCARVVVEGPVEPGDRVEAVATGE